MMTHSELILKAKHIKLAVFDVDGVLTNGQLHFGPQGEEYKIFHVHDGLGIKLLQNSGVAVGIISSRASSTVALRMENLGIKYVYQGQADKRTAFAELLTKLQLSPVEVLYVGDDLPDLPLIKQAGIGVCVANACALLKQHADWQTTLAGGQGAAREVCEFIMTAQGTLEAAHEKFLD